MHHQYFNWKTYKLRKWERYFAQSYGHRMHTDVWKFHFWEIPKWFHIHHKDGDRFNNDISNLECISIREHLSEHWKENWIDEEIGPKMRKWLENAREKAKEWHRSKEWNEWHKEHYEKSKVALHKKMEHNCILCSKVYLSNRKVSSKFCSNSCKTKYRKKLGIDDEIRKCICWNDYRCNKYSMRKYCGCR